MSLWNYIPTFAKWLGKTPTVTDEDLMARAAGVGGSVAGSEILEDIKQAHDQRYVREKHTDYLGGEHFFSYAVGLDVDVNDLMVSRIPQVEAMIVNSEIAELTGMVENGEVAAMDVAPLHPETDTANIRRRTFFRKLLRYIAKNRDIKIARIVFYPVWHYLKFDASYTALQIATYLDITIAQLQIVDNRFQAIHNNLVFIDADDAYVGEVE